MPSFPSSSCSNSSSSSSSSSYSLASTSLSDRLDTIFKKAWELSILCDIEICVIHYGPDGELKTWPEERSKVKDMALRYNQLDEAVRRKKQVNLHEFLLNKKNKDETNLKKKAKKNDNLYGFLNKKKDKTNLRKNALKYPISDHYSPDQVSQLVQSLEQNYSALQERLRFVESQKQKETKLDHQSSTPISLNLHHQDHQQQTQSLNPSQFSLFMYNHEDATLSQIPFSASNFNQDISALLQDSGLKNQLMQTELYGYDQNTCNMGNIHSINFQHPCLSNTQDYSGLIAGQESVNNSGLNQLMQHELYGYDQNMCTSDITNSNVLDPYLSNTVSDEFVCDFQDW